jgi:hypothetical protein
VSMITDKIGGCTIVHTTISLLIPLFHLFPNVFHDHRNGLRDCPTFMINILTVFGNICVYFRLPDWVEDWDESLVENEDDFPSVTAMKRFLRGDDEYRQNALKVMPGTNHEKNTDLFFLFSFPFL